MSDWLTEEIHLITLFDLTIFILKKKLECQQKSRKKCLFQLLFWQKMKSRWLRWCWDDVILFFLINEEGEGELYSFYNLLIYVRGKKWLKTIRVLLTATSF